MAKKVQQKSFEECWIRYVNGSYEFEDSMLRACLKAAATFDETCQVFGAASTSLQFEEITIRSAALQKVIRLASTMSEARRALTLASKRRANGKFYYPVRVIEAQAKVDSFGQDN